MGCRPVLWNESVHPRRRGEHSQVGTEPGQESGSSPQARGTPHNMIRASRDSRFIPAGAGNTSPVTSSASPLSVHPRRRGEHSLNTAIGLLQIGSSPQARGTRQCSIVRRLARRFIPAGAGNTGHRTGSRRPSPVHPRRRGEHLPEVHRMSRNPGSSPQARGTHYFRSDHGNSCRFIPAGAGNTSVDITATHTITVHPRRRGEHPVSVALITTVPGSSPQARGTQETHDIYSRPPRFIPAGAGNTAALPALYDVWSVHPRRRGEHRTAQVCAS